MILVEAYRPSGVGPRPYEYLSPTQILQVPEQCAPDPSPLLVGPYVRVTDQVDIPDPLDTHDAKENFKLVLVAPEDHPSSNLLLKLVRWHIGLVPTISRDSTAIALGRRIHDREYRGAFFSAAEANRAHAGRH